MWSETILQIESRSLEFGLTDNEHRDCGEGKHKPVLPVVTREESDEDQQHDQVNLEFVPWLRVIATHLILNNLFNYKNVS